jgi:hypothetical protein
MVIVVAGVLMVIPPKMRVDRNQIPDCPACAGTRRAASTTPTTDLAEDACVDIQRQNPRHLRGHVPDGTARSGCVEVDSAAALRDAYTDRSPVVHGAEGEPQYGVLRRLLRDRPFLEEADRTGEVEMPLGSIVNRCSHRMSSVRPVVHAGIRSHRECPFQAVIIVSAESIY